MKKNTDLSRRDFLKDSALAGAGLVMMGGLAPSRVLGANDKIRVGVLGSGGRAQYVMKLFKQFPEVEIVASTARFWTARMWTRSSSAAPITGTSRC